MTSSTDQRLHDPADPARWREHIQTYGYVIVHDVVPKANLDAVVADIWRHTGASPDDPESWYQPEVIRTVGMVEMYHYQSMWDNRQHPHVYEVFRAIHGIDELWCSIDRVGLKPPVNPRHPEYDHKGMIHWDTDMSRYPDIEFRVQGVLALTDTEPDMGGFQCIPETYQDLERFLATQTPEQIASRNPHHSAYSITHPRLAAGDLLVWTTQLLHGNGHNVSDKPRLCQYISMNPAGDSASAAGRVDCWRQNMHPAGSPYPGDPRRIEQSRKHPAELTGLGRKLLGLDRWH
jgi:ectoine hydroxylase-related dioxygenase (phytanoyl-CoA dioxygenase family)